MGADYTAEMEWYLSMDDAHLAILSDNFEDAATCIYKFVLPTMKKSDAEPKEYQLMYNRFEKLYSDYASRVRKQ